MHVFSSDSCWWDVTKLWRLAAKLPVKQVKVSELAHNLEGEVKMADLADYFCDVMASDLQYPIILAPDGVIMDGYHRLVKALVLKETTIRVQQFDVMPDPDGGTGGKPMRRA